MRGPRTSNASAERHDTTSRELASGADTILTIGGGFLVKLIGVNLTEAQINPIHG